MQWLPMVVALGFATVSHADPWVVVVHGGAGDVPPSEAKTEVGQAYRDGMTRALNAAGALLSGGGEALDAVQAAITSLEDNPAFNAGKGAVFNAVGENELDASIMRGDTLEAGAVAGVRRVRNPIVAARTVMERSPHVLLAGRGADEFARAEGLDMVDPDYYRTELRWQQYEAAKATGKFGTVGAVVLDGKGNLAAGTSTGGLTFKRFGRVGDSPIIGAGTYADNGSCAVSATGQGEFFIRLGVARSICARVEFQGLDVGRAATAVIQQDLQHLGGSGGVIVLDRQGEIAIEFNTGVMNRGFLRAGGEPVVEVGSR
jgi:beta-aspartyl-peptidase (threonine type)